MKKKIFIIAGLVSLTVLPVYALSNSFQFDPSHLSFTSNSKKEDIVDNFNEEYHLTYTTSDENKELEEEIKNLTKKTTYLLFGDFNNTQESSEDYYKRHQDWFDLRYAPDIPLDNQNPQGIDTNSQEYKDDLVSGLALPQVFNQANEMGLIYQSYGDIRITYLDDMIISSITLPNVKIKRQSKEDPMNYDYIETNYIMYYFYKELNEDWKLYYLYGESTDEVNTYFTEIESSETNGIMSIAPSYESQLETVYNFEKVKSMTQEDLNAVYDANISNIVYLNSYYNNRVVASANGFFIDKGLIVTTWKFIEKSLVNAQYITGKDSHLNPFEIEGIVTLNPMTDIVVLKLKEENSSFVKIGDSETLNIEDPVITLSSKSGTGVLLQTGIIISNDDYIQTSIPLSVVDEGSPLLNSGGEVVGINTSKAAQSSISIAMNAKVLKEIQDKFSSLDFNSLESISFDTLKEKYYYTKYNDEISRNSIPQDKWNEYSQIGAISTTMHLELMKASYKDGIVSLRYKNDISQYINSMQLAMDFKEQLVKEGYELVMDSTSKSIYQNNRYQVILMDEFDYLIVVMVKL